MSGNNMEKREIEARLTAIFNQVLDTKLTAAELLKPDSLRQLNIDSLIVLQIIVRIEQIFSVVIEDDEAALTLFNSFAAIVGFIEKAVKEDRIYITS
jgi:acyl carrier protein